MILSYDIAVDLTPEFNRQLSPKFSVSLGDHGAREYTVRVLQGGEPYEIEEGSTVSIVGKKSDGHIFAYACTYADEYVYFTIEEQMTPVSGIVTCELSIIDASGNKVGSANFTYWVEPSPVTDGEASESDLQLFQQLLDAADDLDDVREILDRAVPIAEQLGDVEKLLTAFPTEETSGSLLTLTDGADGIPVKKLTLSLSPHQEGSGDPSPDNVRPISGYTDVTVTRAGKNLAYMPSVTLTMGVQRSSNISTPINIPIGTYTASLTVTNNTTTKAFNIAFRNSENASVNIAQLTVPAGRTGRFSTTFTSTDVINRFYVYLSTSEASGATITVTDLQVEAGATETEFEPFYSDGTNLLPVYDRTTDTVNGIALTNSNGEYTLNGTSTARAQFDIPVDLSDGMYLVSGQNEIGNSSVSIYLMNSDGDVIRNEKFYVAYDSFVFDQAISKIVKFRISIANGTTLSNFKLTPLILKADFYKTYPITIPTEAGTVYGGSLEINDDGTGTLTVDRAAADMGSFVWVYLSAYNCFYARLNAKDNSALLCDIYKYVGSIGLLTEQSCANAYYSMIAVKDTTYGTDATAFKNGVNGHTVVYFLASPTVYTLTASQVTTLLGNNTVWMDADGSIDLTYRADTQKYIDNRLALLNSNLAYIEDGMTASRAYSVGQFVLIGGQLYKVTASIASGATFTIGTNVTATTVGTELTALA